MEDAIRKRKMTWEKAESKRLKIKESVQVRARKQDKKGHRRDRNEGRQSVVDQGKPVECLPGWDQHPRGGSAGQCASKVVVNGSIDQTPGARWMGSRSRQSLIVQTEERTCAGRLHQSKSFSQHFWQIRLPKVFLKSRFDRPCNSRVARYKKSRVERRGFSVKSVGLTGIEPALQ